ncbi:Cof-type HAD-IIB family hydrolase [Staphylococcus lutrae]|uniref:HAD family hydrolase n=1 Tax=Staphylococcus lutrae TaxID=155085 RepID=A0AAC9RQJ7_9STAP|nr:Cof-type HAD-IIB family hydrolase [Staphylococcus lutrae]ARJ51966.1 HAD family hydrolase [Staphylococcus lutrae]PNZ40028.1 Cof-type HAD-IIB family hydrolase [Staphylococcus lutrae]
MQNVKAIFLDMDGTILQSHNRASEKTAQILNQLREKGYKVFLATGRAYEEIHLLIPDDLVFDGVISSNGTLGHVGDHVLFEHDLSEATVAQIVAAAQQDGIYYEIFPFTEPRFALEEDQTWMLNMVAGDKPEAVHQSEWLSRHEAIKEKLTWRSSLPADLGYSKIYLFHPDLKQIEPFRNRMIEQIEALRIEVSNSTPNNVETMAYQVNKGTGIVEMCRHFNIDRSETLVMGDSDNDRTMFEKGAITVAMKNAAPHIKAMATYETEFDNNADGAALFLQQHLLQNEGL